MKEGAPQEVKQEQEISPETKEWVEKIIAELRNGIDEHLQMADPKEGFSVVHLLQVQEEERLVVDLNPSEKQALINGLRTEFDQNLELAGITALDIQEQDGNLIDIVLRKKKESMHPETVIFTGKCEKCGQEVSVPTEVLVPDNPKFKNPKKGKDKRPYFDVDYPHNGGSVKCSKGCTGDSGAPIGIMLWERRYKEQ